MERIYKQENEMNSGVENKSNVEMVFETTETEPLSDHGMIDQTPSSPFHQDVKIIKQHHTYSASNSASNDNVHSFNVDIICTETMGDEETYIATVAPSRRKTRYNEVSHTKSLLLGCDSSETNMCPSKQVTNVSHPTSEKKSPVIMFKWGSMKKPFRCQICDMSFTDGSLLRSHLEKHKSSRNEPLKPFPCSLCTKSFQSNRSLERHQIIHSGQSQKRCKYCYKVFANKENLEKHLLMHSENASKTQSCPCCNEQFTSRNLEKHISTHLQIKNYQCHICEKSFTRKDGLDRHLYTHDLGKKSKHQCVECSKSFSFLFALKRHVRSVHGGEPDGKICEVCGKFIKNKENIGRHMQLHQGVRPFDCLNCGRKFSQKQHLIDHMVIHTNSLPFQCKICASAFRYRRTLSRHMKKHFKVDKDKKNYECLECHTTHASENEVVQHAAKSHHEFINCIICDKTFGDERIYRRHMLKEHNSSAGLINKSLVNKSTETESWDLAFLGYKTEAEGVESKQARELLKDDATNVIYTVNNTEDEDVAIENEFEYSGDSIESLVPEESNQNIHYSIKGEGTDGQEVVYILYDDRKVQGLDDDNVIIQNGAQISEFIQEQHQVNKDSIVGNQILQISGYGTQSTSYELEESKLEENAAEIVKIKTGTKEEVVDDKRNRIVGISQDTDECAEQALIEIVEGDPSLYSAGETLSTSEESGEKKVLYTYNIVVPKTEKEDGTTVENRMEESMYSAERFKLLQSLIDYAEKIQEEEQSMSSSEKPGASETQI